MQRIRNLCLIFGDQLTLDSALFDDFDPQQDLLWMAETGSFSTKPVSHQQRTLLFLSAMRHFAQQLTSLNYPLHYATLGQYATLDDALHSTLQTYAPARIQAVLPGDYIVCKTLKQCASTHQLPLIWLEDRHFIAEPGEFRQWLSQRKQARMEYWYRYLRKKHGILMAEGQPVGGQWNFDHDNRKTFGRQGPGPLPDAPRFPLDTISQQVLADIHQHLPSLPGTSVQFNWPVTREQSLQLLTHFITHHLPYFGDYQDAIWQGEPFLHHSRLSAALNLKLLSPTEVIQAAELAWQQGSAPLNAVEGFIRQILGWREYVRGLYWSQKDQWEQMNALNAQRPLPRFYWDGNTRMACLHDAIHQVLAYGYGHHIQRLMVTGLYALLNETQPQAVHDWYQGMYVDAVAWVETPNTLGMSQFADGGFLASKPYIASGAYIDKMSNHCRHCPFNPKESTGDKACPFTVLYWHFVDKHQRLLSQNPRLAMQVKHWHNKPPETQAAIRVQATQLLDSPP